MIKPSSWSLLLGLQLGLMLAGAVLPRAAKAQEVAQGGDAPASAPAYHGQTISLNFQSIEVRALLQLLAPLQRVQHHRLRRSLRTNQFARA